MTPGMFRKALARRILSGLANSGAGQLFLVLFYLVPTLSAHAANGRLEVTYIDVGQADAIFVTCPDGNHHLLIDSGDTRYPGSSQHLRSFLTNTFGTKPHHLDLAVASHEHADHIGSMEWVLKNFRVDTYVDNGDTAETTMFANLLTERRKQVKAGQLHYIQGNQNSFSEVDFCPDLKLEIFLPWATKPALSDQNDRSVAIRLDYKERSFLFVGDLEGEAERVMLNQFTEAQRARLKADVLKVGHHASDTSSLDGFIAAVSPQIAVVSVGKPNTGTNQQYKHPRLSTVRHYADWFQSHPPPVKAAAANISAYDADSGAWKQQTRPPGMWLTVKDGSVTVSSDGKELKVTTVPATN